jgi:NRPS condensation-like uncharacterized protein
MPTSDSPQTIPATGTDVAVSITRAVTRQRIGVRLVFSGALDGELLRRAVRLTLDAEPVLGCSFVIARTATWRRIADLDAVVPFSLVRTSDPGAEMDRFQGRKLRSRFSGRPTTTSSASSSATSPSTARVRSSTRTCSPPSTRA